MRKHDQQLLMPERPYYRLLTYASQSALEGGSDPTDYATLGYKADTATISVYDDGAWHNSNPVITRELN